MPGKLYDSAYDIPEDRAEMPVGTVGSEYVKTVYDLDVYGTISAYDGDVMIIHGTMTAWCHTAILKRQLRKRIQGKVLF